MTVFSKTASFNDLVPLLPALDLPATLKMLFSHRNFVHALAGAVGSVTAMTVFYPLDTARTRLQVDDKRKAKSTAYILMDIIQEEGVHSLYRGLLPVLSSLYCSNFLYFYTFNGLKTAFVGRGKTSSSLQDLLFGYLAGIVNVLMTTPLWVVNTRLKLQGATFRTKGLECNKTKKYKGIIDGLLRISQEEGLSTLWSGTGPSLVLAGNPAIQFMVYEAIKKFLMHEDKKALSGKQYFALGAIAKAVSTVVTYPLQVAQCKQRSGHKTPNGKADIFSLLARLTREQGVKGLYKGLEAKLLQTVSTAALMFVAYEKIAAFIFRLLRTTQR
ncbi:peroxisomal membrane protein PMP34-like [Orbicella faveolata]|uniref:peroxisomal membrane protein PMP34-like n=1 Tax=Orbicella faveolata TaxID=48498 RepID=UPI0009E615EE|nr:peroxisomal membrane protein PMP34-like [Orbicella faveolata]